MYTVIVTGGCGFIGSNFINYYLTIDPEVIIINLDCLTYAGNPFNLKDIENHPRYRFVKGDIANRETVKGLFSEPIKAIVNFAAESHVDRSIEDPSPFVRTNVLGTQILLEAALNNKVNRFLQVSTDEVYGSLGKTGYFTETSPLSPNSPYAASKAGADLLVQSYIRTFGLPGIITRCSNNYGPNQFPEKMIPLFVTRLLEDKPVPVYGDGLNVRDWIHVRDHCSALLAVLQHGKTGEVYNIGSNCERTNLELTKLLITTIGKPMSLINYVPDRRAHDRRYAIDATKIRQELGWKPTISFEEGLRETISWYQNNSDWSANIRNGNYQRNY